MQVEDIQVNGWATVNAPVRRVGDLRMLLSFLDEHSVPDEAEIDWGTGQVHVDLADLVGEFIACGDHVPPESAYDVLLTMHSHDHNKSQADQYRQSLREWLGMNDWRGPDYAR